MTIHWKAVEQYFTVVLFVFRFSPVFNFGKFDNFGHGTVRSERLKIESTFVSSANLIKTTYAKRTCVDQLNSSVASFSLHELDLIRRLASERWIALLNVILKSKFTEPFTGDVYTVGGEEMKRR